MHRRYLCVLPFYVLCLLTIVHSKCPARCECSLDETLQVAQAGAKHVIAKCWLPTNLPKLECASSWRILHLQILDAKSYPLTSSQLSGVPRSFPIDTVEQVQPTGSQVPLSSSFFTQCSSVTRLAILEKSQLSQLPRDTLRPMVNLERLLIQSQELQNLEDHLLAFVPKLSFLMISSSQRITDFSRQVFEPCPKTLHTIRLSSNKLQGYLQPGLFSHCDLRDLWLNGNLLIGLNVGSLSGLRNLQQLRLSHNRMAGSLDESLGYNEDTRRSALFATPRLEMIDLSNNQLASVNGTGWSGLCVGHITIEDQNGGTNMGLCYLRTLNLANNELEWLAPNAFASLPSLTTLDLAGNSKLYQFDSVISLSLCLHSLLMNRVAISHLSLPVLEGNKIADNRPWQFHSRSLQLCKITSKQLDPLPRSLVFILNKLNSSVCGSPSKLKSTDVRFLTYGDPLHKGNASLLFDVTDEQSVSSLVLFIRKATRPLLVVLCLGLIFVGVFITALVMCCVYCCLRRPRKKKQVSRPFNPRPAIGTQNQYLMKPLLPSPPTQPHILSPRINPAESLYSGLVRMPQPAISYSHIERHNLLPPITSSFANTPNLPITLKRRTSSTSEISRRNILHELEQRRMRSPQNHQRQLPFRPINSREALCGSPVYNDSLHNERVASSYSLAANTTASVDDSIVELRIRPTGRRLIV